jgi:thiamine biosynthesis protein ThiS
MQITVNGEAHRFDISMSVTDLLNRLGLPNAKIAIERNLEIVPKSAYDSTHLAEGDKIEIVHFIGGG